MARIIGVVIALLTVCGHVAAQPPGSMPHGEASLSGRVVEHDSRRPIPGVVLTLIGTRGGGLLVAQTDENGRYHFDGIAGGIYRLSAQHPRYGQHTYGFSTPPRATGPDLTIAAAEKRTGVDFELVPAGSISGRVITENGDPLEGAQVSARWTAGMTPSVPPWQIFIRTDDRGEYLLSNLPEGLYYVLVRCCLSERSSAAGADSRPIYFPGTSELAEASGVTVAAAETTKGINVIIPSSELLRIHGRFVRNSTGGRIEAFLLAGSSRIQTVAVAADGSFTTPRLRTGRYTLVGRTRESDELEATWLTVDLSSEMRDVILGLSATGTIAGRVVTDDGSAVSDTLQLAAVLADDGREIDPLRRDRTDVGLDGTFTISGLFGERILNVIGLPAGWRVDRVQVGKSPMGILLVHPGQRIEDITILLTRR